MEECKNRQKNFLATRAKLAEHPVEKVGAGLRAMMPWIGKKKLVDSDKKQTIVPYWAKLTDLFCNLNERLYISF